MNLTEDFYLQKFNITQEAPESISFGHHGRYAWASAVQYLPQTAAATYFLSVVNMQVDGEFKEERIGALITYVGALKEVPVLIGGNAWLPRKRKGNTGFTDQRVHTQICKEAVGENRACKGRAATKGPHVINQESRNKPRKQSGIFLLYRKAEQQALRGRGSSSRPRAPRKPITM
eukprot:1161075-Pelagomonas_calceolata.AAC.3